MPGAPGVELRSFQLAHAIRAICYEIATIRSALGGSAELDPSVDAPLFQLDQSGNASIDAIALRKAADALAEALSSLAPFITSTIDNLMAMMLLLVEHKVRSQPDHSALPDPRLLGESKLRMLTAPVFLRDDTPLLAARVFGA